MDEFNVEPQVEKGKSNKKPLVVGVVMLAVVAILVSVFIVQAAYNRAKSENVVLASPSANGPLAGPSPAELSNSFRAVAKAVKQAVVHINTVETVQPTSILPSFPGFEFPGGDMPRKQQGTGSGVIISADGYVLTNNHVVGEADKIDVVLSDGRRLKGKRVGTDPETDLAVVRVDASSLPVAVLGDSDQMDQGDWVVALGSPFGLQQTLTAGVVSATSRELDNRSPFDRYIQTDASINPGNSGGPLVNLRGEVIGINTMIVTRSGGSEGIGFAIPSNLARKVYSELIKSGKVTRGYLGVFIAELDDAQARALGVTRDAGVLVGDLSKEDSPAAKAGLKSGDVITAVNGKKVKTPTELTSTVADIPVGSTAKIDYIRDSKPHTVNVVIGERPPIENARMNRNDTDKEPQLSRLGVSVQNISPELAQRFGLKSQSGALVIGVQPGSPGADANMRAGDVILRFDRKVIKTAEDLIDSARSLKDGDEVALQIERRGQMAFITVRIE